MMMHQFLSVMGGLDPPIQGQKFNRRVRGSWMAGSKAGHDELRGGLYFGSSRRSLNPDPYSLTLPLIPTPARTG